MFAWFSLISLSLHHGLKWCFIYLYQSFAKTQIYILLRPVYKYKVNIGSFSMNIHFVCAM